MKSKQPIIVTGAAGFIAFHVIEALLLRGERVVGFDALTPYNDPALKKRRLTLLRTHKRFSFVKGDLVDAKRFEQVVRAVRPRAIIHLAAQAGVRYSLSHPQTYVESNVLGSTNVFEAARIHSLPVVYASSSSVYGERAGIFKETDRTDSQASIYAATKKATEVLAETYHRLYGLPLVGLRFFTVYGPWMRTDLAIFKFAHALLAGKTIPLYANGKGKRSYTHVSLVAQGICAALDRMKSGHTIYNLGDERTFETTHMLDLLSRELGVRAKVKRLPPQKGDVMLTHASLTRAKRELGVTATVPLAQGLHEFAGWCIANKRFLLSLKDMHL